MNKWLSMGITPPETAEQFPPSPFENLHTKRKVAGAKGGANPAHRKDFLPQLEAIESAFGESTFTYKDIMALFSTTRFAADKILAKIKFRTTCLTSISPPRTSRGRAPAIYTLRPDWRVRLTTDIAAFNAANPTLFRPR